MINTSRMDELTNYIEHGLPSPAGQLQNANIYRFQDEFLGVHNSPIPTVENQSDRSAGDTGVTDYLELSPSRMEEMLVTSQDLTVTPPEWQEDFLHQFIAGEYGALNQPTGGVALETYMSEEHKGHDELSGGGARIQEQRIDRLYGRQNQSIDGAVNSQDDFRQHKKASGSQRVFDIHSESQIRPIPQLKPAPKQIVAPVEVKQRAGRTDGIQAVRVAYPQHPPATGPRNPDVAQLLESDFTCREYFHTTNLQSPKKQRIVNNMTDDDLLVQCQPDPGRIAHDTPVAEELVLDPLFTQTLDTQNSISSTITRVPQTIVPGRQVAAPVEQKAESTDEIMASKKFFCNELGRELSLFNYNDFPPKTQAIILQQMKEGYQVIELPDPNRARNQMSVPLGNQMSGPVLNNVQMCDPVHSNVQLPAPAHNTGATPNSTEQGQIEWCDARGKHVSEKVALANLKQASTQLPARPRPDPGHRKVKMANKAQRKVETADQVQLRANQSATTNLQVILNPGRQGQVEWCDSREVSENLSVVSGNNAGPDNKHASLLQEAMLAAGVFELSNDFEDTTPWSAPVSVEHILHNTTHSSSATETLQNSDVKDGPVITELSEEEAPNVDYRSPVQELFSEEMFDASVPASSSSASGGGSVHEASTSPGKLADVEPHGEHGELKEEDCEALTFLNTLLGNKDPGVVTSSDNKQDDHSEILFELIASSDNGVDASSSLCRHQSDSVGQCIYSPHDDNPDLSVSRSPVCHTETKCLSANSSEVGKSKEITTLNQAMFLEEGFENNLEEKNLLEIMSDPNAIVPEYDNNKSEETDDFMSQYFQELVAPTRKKPEDSEHFMSENEEPLKCSQECQEQSPTAAKYTVPEDVNEQQERDQYSDNDTHDELPPLVSNNQAINLSHVERQYTIESPGKQDYTACQGHLESPVQGQDTDGQCRVYVKRPAQLSDMGSPSKSDSSSAEAADDYDQGHMNLALETFDKPELIQGEITVEENTNSPLPKNSETCDALEDLNKYLSSLN